VHAGSEISLYTTDRNWRFAKKVYATCNVLATPNDYGQVPLHQRDTSNSPFSNPTYRTITERELYKYISEGRAVVGKSDVALSVADTNFQILWESYCNGLFDKARQCQQNDGNPALWLGVANYGTNCRIKSLSYSRGSEYDIKFEILGDNGLLPHASHPDLLEAVVIFNSIITSR
jgi:hypothetical protein